MSELEHDPLIESIASELRRPERFDASFDARVMAALETPVIELATARPRHWFFRTRHVAISPLRALAAAAGIGALMFATARQARLVAPATTVATVPAPEVAPVPGTTTSTVPSAPVSRDRSRRLAPAPVAGVPVAPSGSVPTTMQVAVDSRLAARLDDATGVAVQMIVDSVRGEGLPSEPLVVRALEGASRRTDGAVIVSVVNRLAGDLRAAKRALGASASSSEIVAGMDALDAGLSVRDLERLRSARPDRSVAVALNVFGKLADQGVPSDTLARAIAGIARYAATDEVFLAFAEGVEKDVRGGVAAGSAALARGVAMEQQAQVAASNPDGGAMRTGLPSARGTTVRGTGSVAGQPAAVSANVSPSDAKARGTVGAEGTRPAAPRGKPKIRR